MHEWDFGPVWAARGELLDGLIGTLWLSASCILVSLVCGLILAVLSLSRHAAVSKLAMSVVYVLRSSAALVVLMWCYIVLPRLLGIEITAFWAATLALGVQSAGSMSEIFRAGITSVSPGQWEAGRALSLSRNDVFRYVVLPQAVRRMTPVLMSFCVDLIKGTSLAAVITYSDLSYVATNVSSQSYRPMETYAVVAIIYFIVIFGASLAVRGVERRLRARD